MPSSSNVTVGVIQLDNFNNQSNQNINNDNNKIIAKIAPATDALADNNTIIDTKSEPDDILLKKTNVEKNSENTNTNIKQNKTDNTSNNETTAKQLTQSQLNNTKPKDQKLDSKKRLDTKTNIVPKTKKSNLQIDDMIDNISGFETSNNKNNTFGGNTNALGAHSIYADNVIKLIRPFVIIPDGNIPASAVVKVTLLPNLLVYKIELIQSSGNSQYDDNVQDAIFKAHQFPSLPKNVQFKDYRVLILNFNPNTNNAQQ